MDKETQIKMVEAISNFLVENNDFIKALSSITNVEEENIKNTLNGLIEDYTYESDYDLVITTTGMLYDVIEVDLIGTEDYFSYIDYNEKQTFDLSGLKIEKTTNKKDTIINFDLDTIKGTLTYQEDQKSDSKTSGTMKLDLQIDNDTYNILLTGTVDYNANITKEEYENAKLAEDFTAEEALQIYSNLNNKLAGTSLEEVLKDFLAGAV